MLNQVMDTFTIALLLLYYAISFSYAETCPEDDREIGCSLDKKDVCISGYEKSKVTGTPNLLTYKYSYEEQISLTCHATKFRNGTKKYMKWKKGDETASNKTTCHSQAININLLSRATRTNYTCMVSLPDYGESDSFISVIEFVYSPSILTTNDERQQNETLKDTEKKDKKKPPPKPLTLIQCMLILFSSICILAAMITILFYMIVKKKKVQTQGRQRLQSEVTSISQGNISINNPQSPQLCDTYATPQTNTASATIYCDPYVAMYSQPIPKNRRNPKNTKNYTNIYSNNEAISNSNTNNTAERYINLKNVKQSDGEMYSEPFLYDNIS